ncbi:MAG: DUF4440 domain-containing protein [Planctomycetota bacterium]
MSEDAIQQVLQLNYQLLDAISAADWKTYEKLCDPTLTCFEPEARGQLVEGMDFHRFYFELGGVEGLHNTTITSPHVRLLGEDVAVVCYVRLLQHQPGGNTKTGRYEETRVWVHTEDGWKHVHFHRSKNE